MRTGENKVTIHVFAAPSEMAPGADWSTYGISRDVAQVPDPPWPAGFESLPARPTILAEKPDDVITPVNFDRLHQSFWSHQRGVALSLWGFVGRRALWITLHCDRNTFHAIAGHLSALLWLGIAGLDETAGPGSPIPTGGWFVDLCEKREFPSFTHDLPRIELGASDSRVRFEAVRRREVLRLAEALTHACGGDSQQAILQLAGILQALSLAHRTGGGVSVSPWNSKTTLLIRLAWLVLESWERVRFPFITYSDSHPADVRGLAVRVHDPGGEPIHPSVYFRSDELPTPTPGRQWLAERVFAGEAAYGALADTLARRRISVVTGDALTTLLEYEQWQLDWQAGATLRLACGFLELEARTRPARQRARIAGRLVAQVMTIEPGGPEARIPELRKVLSMMPVDRRRHFLWSVVHHLTKTGQPGCEAVALELRALGVIARPELLREAETDEFQRLLTDPVECRLLAVLPRVPVSVRTNVFLAATRCAFQGRGEWPHRILQRLLTTPGFAQTAMESLSGTDVCPPLRAGWLRAVAAELPDDATQRSAVWLRRWLLPLASRSKNCGELKNALRDRAWIRAALFEVEDPELLHNYLVVADPAPATLLPTLAELLVHSPGEAHLDAVATHLIRRDQRPDEIRAGLRPYLIEQAGELCVVRLLLTPAWGRAGRRAEAWAQAKQVLREDRSSGLAPTARQVLSTAVTHMVNTLEFQGPNCELAEDMLRVGLTFLVAHAPEALRDLQLFEMCRRASVEVGLRLAFATADAAPPAGLVEQAARGVVERALTEGPPTTAAHDADAAVTAALSLARTVSGSWSLLDHVLEHQAHCRDSLLRFWAQGGPIRLQIEADRRLRAARSTVKPGRSWLLHPGLTATPTSIKHV